MSAHDYGIENDSLCINLCGQDKSGQFSVAAHMPVPQTNVEEASNHYDNGLSYDPVKDYYAVSVSLCMVAADRERDNLLGGLQVLQEELKAGVQGCSSQLDSFNRSADMLNDKLREVSARETSQTQLLQPLAQRIGALEQRPPDPAPPTSRRVMNGHYIAFNTPGTKITTTPPFMPATPNSNPRVMGIAFLQ